MNWDSFTIENNNNHRTLYEIFNEVLGVQGRSPREILRFLTTWNIENALAECTKTVKNLIPYGKSFSSILSLWEKFSQTTAPPPGGGGIKVLWSEVQIYP